MPYLQLADVRIFYTDQGSGPPVLLVHGFTADSHDWSWQIPHLAATHRVVAIDLRGHGSSSAPPDGYTTEQLATDVAAVAEHLSLGPAVAIGHSMGASIVSVLAVERPSQVAAVVVVDPAYLIDDAVVDAIGPLIRSLDDEAIVELVVSIVGAGMDSPGRDAALRTWQTRRVESVEPHVLRGALAVQTSGMALRSTSEPYLRRRAVPVLAFHTDPSRAALESGLFADLQSRAIAWEGSGHWLHQERSRELNAIVTTWLAEIGHHGNPTTDRPQTTGDP